MAAGHVVDRVQHDVQNSSGLAERDDGPNFILNILLRLCGQQRPEAVLGRAENLMTMHIEEDCIRG